MLGLGPVLIFNLARKDAGLLESFKAQEIDLFVEYGRETTQFLNHYEHHRRTQKLFARADPIRLAGHEELMGQHGHIHLGPLHPQDISTQDLHLLSDPRLLVTLDVQGYVRSIQNQRIVAEASPLLSEVLPNVQILKGDVDEVNLLLGYFSCSMDELIQRFSISELIVTDGENGGVVYGQSGELYRYESSGDLSPADTTGAGDVFFAVYLHARLYVKKSIYEAVQTARSTTEAFILGNFFPANALLLPKNS